MTGSDESSQRDPADEPRAADLVAGQVREEELDPETIAQLAAWFGPPQAGVVVPQSQPVEDDTPFRKERREIAAKVEAALDHGLATRLESMREAGDDFINLPEPMTLGIEREIAALDMSVWRVRTVETRDRERPDEVVDALTERAPQAILRDLHRPVLSWPYLMLPQELGIDVGGLDATKRVHEIATTSYRVRMAEFPTAFQEGYQILRDLYQHIDEPWDEIEIPEERRSASSQARTAEDMMWFGGIGYDPTI